jgi:hypothetical protein
MGRRDACALHGPLPRAACGRSFGAALRTRLSSTTTATPARPTLDDRRHGAQLQRDASLRSGSRRHDERAARVVTSNQLQLKRQTRRLSETQGGGRLAVRDRDDRLPGRSQSFLSQRAWRRTRRRRSRQRAPCRSGRSRRCPRCSRGRWAFGSMTVDAGTSLPKQKSSPGSDSLIGVASTRRCAPASQERTSPPSPCPSAITSVSIAE